MSSASGASNQPPKHSRVLACVLCQHRKIKCDRNTPCSNCLKANVTCTPSIPAPARKRRRPNQDLQERLARCEALLKQYAGGIAPSSSSSSQGLDPKQSLIPSDFGVHQLPQPQQDTPGSGLSPTTSPSSETPDRRPTGRIIHHEGGSRFIDNQLWTSFYEELHAMRQIVDSEDPAETSALGNDDSFSENNADLVFPSDGASSSVEDHLPDPVQAFRLWQIYLDRVNPLTKIIHVPTVQPYVIESTTDPSNIPPSYQALILGIYLMGTSALSETECQQQLGTTRDQAVRQFSRGTKQALLRFDFLRNYDMAALQALILFLFSLRGRYDRHATWILSGTIIRIAIKMGYHRDGELLNLSPFETEMRRRIWWQVVLLDTQLAINSGLSHNLPQRAFDTKPPQNVNDADLFPGSQEPVHSRDGPTEMPFVLISSRLAQFMLSENTLLGLERAVLDQGEGAQGFRPFPNDPQNLQNYREFAQQLDRNLREIESRYIDESAGGVHSAALCLRSMVTVKMQDMLVPMEEQPEWGTEIFGPRDNFFKITLINNERDAEAYERLVEFGFGWFVKQHLQLDIFAALTGQLYQHATGSLSDRGWAVVARTYKAQPDLFDLSNKQHLTQAQFTLRAWKAREEAFAACGRTVDIPEFIHRLREALSTAGDLRPSNVTSATPPLASQAQGAATGDQSQFLDQEYVDMSAVNWDMWGDMMPGNNGNNQNTMPATFFGGFGLGNLGHMSGM